MAKYISLFNYIKQKNIELDSIYDISDLKQKLKIYQDNYELISSDITRINIDLIKNLLSNYYSSQETNEYITYLDVLIDLKLENITIVRQDILGKKIINFIEILKKSFQDKIEEIKNRIKEINDEKQNNKLEFEKYLEYFNISEDTLKKELKKEELQDLIEFIKSSDLISSDKFDIIMSLTLDNMKKLSKIHPNVLEDAEKRIISIRTGKAVDIHREINDVVESQEIIEEITPIEEIQVTEEEFELTDEEKELINQIKEIYDILKKEIKLSYDDIEFVKLFVDSNLRKDILDDMPSIEDNIWKYVYADLKYNFYIESDSFIKLFKDNEESWIDIFNYYINLYNNRFVSNNVVKLSLDVISSEEKSNIKSFIDQAYNITEEEKSKYRNADYIYQADGEEGLRKTFGNAITKDHIDYYNKLLEFNELYQEYDRLISMSINDTYVLSQVKDYVTELKNDLIQLLNDLNELKNRIESQKLILSDYTNLLVFLPSEGIDILDQVERSRKLNDIVNQQKLALKKLFGGESDNYFSNDLNYINGRLLRVKFDDLDYKEDKKQLEAKKISERKVAEYPSYRIRGAGPKGGRVCYMKIDLTDYNKKTLMDIFGMKSLDYLCVVLNLDGSIRGKKEYVARTSAYIEENEPYIQEVQRIFTTDFTADTLKKAVRIITNSFNDLFKLQKDTEEKTSIVQSTPTIIESENNEQEITEQLELGGEEPNVR